MWVTRARAGVGVHDWLNASRCADSENASNHTDIDAGGNDVTSRPKPQFRLGVPCYYRYSKYLHHLCYLCYFL